MCALNIKTRSATLTSRSYVHVTQGRGGEVCARSVICAAWAGQAEWTQLPPLDTQREGTLAWTHWEPDWSNLAPTGIDSTNNLETGQH